MVEALSGGKAIGGKVGGGVIASARAEGSRSFGPLARGAETKLQGVRPPSLASRLIGPQESILKPRVIEEQASRLALVREKLALFQAGESAAPKPVLPQETSVMSELTLPREEVANNVINHVLLTGDEEDPWWARIAAAFLRFLFQDIFQDGIEFGQDVMEDRLVQEAIRKQLVL